MRVSWHARGEDPRAASAACGPFQLRRSGGLCQNASCISNPPASPSGDIEWFQLRTDTRAAIKAATVSATTTTTSIHVFTGVAGRCSVAAG